MVTQTLNTAHGLTANDTNASKTVKMPFGMARLPVCWKTPNDSLLWAPLIDMYSCQDKFIVRAEMPGVSEEDIAVSLAGNDLVIKAERKIEKTRQTKEYYCSEIAQGTIFRSVPLPFDVKKNRIEATYTDGVLEIVMPRNVRAAESKIAVKVKATGRKKKKNS
jgi:HSP20 family protein